MSNQNRNTLFIDALMSAAEAHKDQKVHYEFKKPTVEEEVKEEEEEHYDEEHWQEEEEEEEEEVKSCREEASPTPPPGIPCTGWVQQQQQQQQHAHTATPTPPPFAHQPQQQPQQQQLPPFFQGLDENTKLSLLQAWYSSGYWAGMAHGLSGERVL